MDLSVALSFEFATVLPVGLAAFPGVKVEMVDFRSVALCDFLVAPGAEARVNHYSLLASFGMRCRNAHSPTSSAIVPITSYLGKSGQRSAEPGANFAVPEFVVDHVLVMIDASILSD